MYLVVIHVPFQQVRPGVARVSSDWGRALFLLRDSLRGRCGEIVVASPTLPPDHTWNEQLPVDIDAAREHIRFEAVCPANLRARQFWPRVTKLLRTCRRLAAEADVVHCGTSDLYRPIPQLGFLAARLEHRPTVFFEDTDIVTQIHQLDGGKISFKNRLYCWAFERSLRAIVARADLSFLKGRLLMERYARFARNARDFLDTSHGLDWCIGDQALDAKLAELVTARTLRCVSVGRLVARKGVDHSLQVMAELQRLGVPATLDILGNGPERAALEAQAGREQLANRVRFLDAVPYGPQMLADLQRYDLMLFTPLAEDTPRSIFDVLAAGVPVAGYAIDFVRDVIGDAGCGVTAPMGDWPTLAREIQSAWAHREEFLTLTRSAAASGRDNAAECWYDRRAQWTLDLLKPPSHLEPQSCTALEGSL
jgi:glycosyltransferase involved in cell wall biosynthesis